MKSDSARLKRPSRFAHLLAQGVQGRNFRAVCRHRPQCRRLAALAGQKPITSPGRAAIFRDDVLQHLAGVVDTASARPRRPCRRRGWRERARPVPRSGRTASSRYSWPVRPGRNWQKCGCPERPARRRRLGKIDRDRIGARVGELQPLLAACCAEHGRGDLFVFGADLGGIGLAARPCDSRLDATPTARAGVGDIDRLAAA